MTWPRIMLVAVAAAGSMAATWIMICSVLPSIRLREAAAVNLGSSVVANTMPAGGALAMGVSWAMLSSWGVGTEEYVLYTLVSGTWNVFARLGLPVVAVLVLLTDGRPGAGLIAAVAAVAAAVLGGLIARNRYRSWAYREREEDLIVARGVLVRRVSVVPYGRMQFVEVTAGPAERAFKLATVQLHTAAAGSDARIPGLERDEAARLRDRLATLGEAKAAGL